MNQNTTAPPPPTMMAARVHAYGSPNVINVESVGMPTPGPGEALVRVAAAGVGPWDALIRTGHSGIPQSLPLTLGSDISGEVVQLGDGVDSVCPSDAVYGVTNPSFVGAYAQYALAKASMITAKPPQLSDLEAASAPVIGVTALQMLARANLDAGQSVLVHGATGNVGGYAARMAAARGLTVFATARRQDEAVLRALPLSGTVDLTAPPDPATAVDAAIDLVGGTSQSQLFGFIKHAGVLVSSVSPPDADQSAARGIHAEFFIVEVDSGSLDELSTLFRTGVIRPAIGAVFPLSEARWAHELMADRSRPPGKILLQVAAGPAP